MTQDLENVFVSSSSRYVSDHERDVTLALGSKYTCADWTVSKATLHVDDSDESAILIAVLGLRGVILEPFKRFMESSSDVYLPCDIFSLVPLVGLMVSGRGASLSGGAIEKRNDGTYAILTFEAKTDYRGGWQRHLARKVHKFITTWHEWACIIQKTVDRHPEVGPWSIDWKEFLAGESGYSVMTWHPSMSYAERVRGIEVVGIAAKTLLVSVLTGEELQDPFVRGMINWISSLCPVQELERYTSAAEEAV